MKNIKQFGNIVSNLGNHVSQYADKVKSKLDEVNFTPQQEAMPQLV